MTASPHPRVSRHYVLAAGGTGGHLIPAFALTDELIARGHHVALITDARGAMIPGKPAACPAHVLPAGRSGGLNPWRWLRTGAAIWQARAMALRVFESFAPAAVIGFGGYPALPALLAARAAKIPTLIHEQNAVMGRVNRLLARRVDGIVTAARVVHRLHPRWAHKVHCIGNPVRAEVLALRDRPFPAFEEEGLLRILVTGGSQGARVLSEVVPDGLAMLPPALRGRLQVTQQCRAEDIDSVRRRYGEHNIPAELATYFEDIAARLADTHLFIGRAGASTIAELAVVGRPAILIPLPIATDDHQAANTAEIVAAGGARAIRESRFTPVELAKQIQSMAQHPHALANAAHAAWNCGYPHATRDLADLVEQCGGAPLMEVIRVNELMPGRAPRAVTGGASA